MKVGISGTGGARLAGSAKKLTAIIRGTSAFEAMLDREGCGDRRRRPGVIRATVTNSAKVDALASPPSRLAATRPARRASGSAVVTGCKD